MKTISKQELVQIIKEEIKLVLKERHDILVNDFKNLIASKLMNTSKTSPEFTRLRMIQNQMKTNLSAAVKRYIRSYPPANDQEKNIIDQMVAIISKPKETGKSGIRPKVHIW